MMGTICKRHCRRDITENKCELPERSVLRSGIDLSREGLRAFHVVACIFISSIQPGLIFVVAMLTPVLMVRIEGPGIRTAFGLFSPAGFLAQFTKREKLPPPACLGVLDRKTCSPNPQ